jgi:hypothetical protein
MNKLVVGSIAFNNRICNTCPCADRIIPHKPKICQEGELAFDCKRFKRLSKKFKRRINGKQ